MNKLDPSSDAIHQDLSHDQNPGEPREQSTEQVTRNILRGADGKYRWSYDFSLYRNPTILVLLWKIFFFILLGMFLLMLLLQSGQDGFQKAITGLAPVFGALMAGLFVLITFAYLLYAAIMGGKYSVIFEMDQVGVKHIQLSRQFERSQLLSYFSMLAGLASGQVSAVAPGFNAAMKQSTYSKFQQVRAIAVDRRHEVIKLRTSDLVHNQVYAAQDDFDFVLSFIQSRVPANRASKQ